MYFCNHKTPFVLDTNFFSAILLPGTLALIMFGMGLSLTRQDFITIARQPKGIFIGLVAQMLLLPLLGFAIASIIPGLSPELKVGIVLLAACPGGATSNLLNYLLNGNLALSVSITTVNSFLTQFSIPVLVNLALYAFMDRTTGAEINLPFWETLVQIISITVLPAAAGIYIRSRYPNWSESVRIPLKYIMTLLMGIAMLGAIFLEKNENLNIPLSDYWRVLPLAVLLNLSGMFAGFYFARMFRLGLKSQTTIAIEVGLQNTALAIAIATGPYLLNNPAYAIPAAIYALTSFFVSGGFGVVASRKYLRIKFGKRKLL